MNINLQTLAEGYVVAAEIDDHIASMVMAGYPLSPEHDHVLVPEGAEFPGSYQIWLKVVGDRTHMVGWIYVDADGVVNHRMFPGGKVELPSANKEDPTDMGHHSGLGDY